MHLRLFCLIILLASFNANGQSLRDSLKAHFKFEGNLLDETAFHEDLTSNFTPVYHTVSSTNQAISFDTQLQLSSLRSFNNSQYQEVTVSLWMNAQSRTNASPQTMLQGAFMGFGIFLQPNGEASTFFDASSYNSIISNFSVIDTNWHHIVAQNDGQYTSLYIDGVFLKSQYDTLFVGNGGVNNKLYMGLTNLNLSPYSGLLDNVRIYNRLLSRTEIDSLYNFEKPRNITTVSNASLKKASLVIYPNPTEDIIHLDVTENLLKAQLNIRDMVGKLIYTTSLNQIELLSIEIEGQSGIYFVELINQQGERRVSKIIKK